MNFALQALHSVKGVMMKGWTLQVNKLIQIFRGTDQGQGFVQRLALDGGDSVGGALLISITQEDEDAVPAKGNNLTLSYQLDGQV
jgi:hypothetical protein